MTSPEAGWYQDPENPGQTRYWNGSSWAPPQPTPPPAVPNPTPPNQGFIPPVAPTQPAPFNFQQHNQGQVSPNQGFQQPPFQMPINGMTQSVWRTKKARLIPIIVIVLVACIRVGLAFLPAPHSAQSSSSAADATISAWNTMTTADTAAIVEINSTDPATKTLGYKAALASHEKFASDLSAISYPSSYRASVNNLLTTNKSVITDLSTLSTTSPSSSDYSEALSVLPIDMSSFKIANSTLNIDLGITSK